MFDHNKTAGCLHLNNKLNLRPTASVITRRVTNIEAVTQGDILAIC